MLEVYYHILLSKQVNKVTTSCSPFMILPEKWRNLSFKIPIRIIKNTSNIPALNPNTRWTPAKSYLRFRNIYINPKTHNNLISLKSEIV